MTQRSDPGAGREEAAPHGRVEATPSRRATWIRVALLVALTWAVYSNSLHGPFAFDDWHVIPQNPAVRGPADIPGFFTDVSSFSILKGNQGYRPVFLSSMAISWWLGGGDTLPFHLVSVGIHAANVVLLFFVVRLVLSSRNARPRTAKPNEPSWAASNEWTAWIASALFAVHPLATESVDYISSQSVPLAACFYLSSFLMFLVVRRGSEHAAARRVWPLQIASLLSYLLALLSKPIAITLPLNLVLWDLLLGEPPNSESSHRRGWKQHAARLWKHVPYVAVTFLYLLIRRAAEPAGILREPPREVYVHYLTQTKALVFYYLQLALVPVNQNVDVEYPVSTSALDWPVLSALLILCVIAWLAVRLRHHRALLFWSAWFPSCLLVTTYIMVLGQIVNEHRVYLSLAGICVVVALALSKLRTSFPSRLGPLRIDAPLGRALTAGLVACLLVGLSLGTRERNRIWSSGLTLWEDAALHGGTYRAHMNYGLALEGAGRLDEALEQLEMAVALRPYAFPHINLGLGLVKRGRVEQGLLHMRRAVSLWPTLPEAHLWLAYALEVAGDLEAAESELRRSIELRPNYLRAYRQLSSLYAKLDRPELALEAYRRLVDLDPSARGVALHFELAWELHKQGERDEAARLYEELLEATPNHRQGTFNLAYLYLQSESEDAWSRSATLFARLLASHPSYDEAIHHLATTLWKLGRDEEARAQDRRYLESGSNRALQLRSRQRLAGPESD